MPAQFPPVDPYSVTDNGAPSNRVPDPYDPDLEQPHAVIYGPGEVEFLEMQTLYLRTLENADLRTSDISDLVNAAIRYGRSL